MFIDPFSLFLGSKKKSKQLVLFFILSFTHRELVSGDGANCLELGGTLVDTGSLLQQHGGGGSLEHKGERLVLLFARVGRGGGGEERRKKKTDKALAGQEKKHENQ